MSMQLKFYVFVILYQKFIGIAPYNYDNLKRKFVTSKLYLIYPLAVILIYSYTYFLVLCKYNVRPESLLLSWLSYGRFITILLPWFVHCTRRKAIVQFFNDAFHLNGTLCRHFGECSDGKEFQIVRTLLKAGLVTVLNACVHLYAVSVTTMSYRSVYVSGSVGVFATSGLTLFTRAIQSANPTTFYGMTLIAKLYFRKLNCSK